MPSGERSVKGEGDEPRSRVGQSAVLRSVTLFMYNKKKTDNISSKWVYRKEYEQDMEKRSRLQTSRFQSYTDKMAHWKQQEGHT